MTEAKRSDPNPHNPLHSQESDDPTSRTWHHGYPAYWSAHEPPGWDPVVAVCRYVDTGELVDDKRPCAKCGLEFRPCDHDDCIDFEDVHDPCIGHLEGDIASACCGHGVEPGHLNVRVIVHLPPYPGWGSHD